MKCLMLLSGLLLFTFCRHHAKSKGSEGEVVTVAEFLGMFRTLKLPLQFADSSLQKKDKDSSLSSSVVRTFIPDSVFTHLMGKGSKPHLLAAGRVTVKKGETYLFIKASVPGKRALYVACFSKEDSFVAAMPLVYREDGSLYDWVATMDLKYTITVDRQRKDAVGRPFYKKSVYVFNDAGAFTLIMMESNEEKTKLAAILNPIDTVSHHHKLTGDYLQDKRNFISFRDTKNPSLLLFFVHFEKDEGTCKGELKGQAKIVSPNTARYTANGDPCSIQFTFMGNEVNMKELEGCGSHRDIKCYFDGTYQKQKESKPKPTPSRPAHHKIK